MDLLIQYERTEEQTILIEIVKALAVTLRLHKSVKIFVDKYGNLAFLTRFTENNIWKPEILLGCLQTYA